MAKENQVESDLVRQLEALKYVYRPDIIDRKTLEQNFRAKRIRPATDFLKNLNFLD